MGHHDQLFLQPTDRNRFGNGESGAYQWRSEADGTLGRLQFGVMDVDTRSSGPESLRKLFNCPTKGILVGWIVRRRDGHRQALWHLQDSFNQTGGVDTRLVFFKDCSWMHMWPERNHRGAPVGNSDVGASLSYRSNWVEGYSNAEKLDQLQSGSGIHRTDGFQ